MKELKKLEHELTEKGVQILEGYKKNSVNVPDELTESLRSIIKSTIEDFIKEL